MKKRILLIISCIFLALSCQDKNIVIPQPQEQAEYSPYSISKDKALLYLNEYLEQTGDIGTKSGVKRAVSFVTPIRYKKVSTRSETQDSVECDNLLYIANFDNGQGYAILAADNRISEKVIAVTDDGSLSEETVYAAINRTRSNNGPETERLSIDGYPHSGPCFFTDSLFGNEVFLNPNTANYYVIEEQDTLVGNYRFDDIGEEYENGDPVPGNNLYDEDPDSFASTLCVEYALDEISSGGGGLPSDQDPKTWETPVFDRPGKDGTLPPPTREEVTYSSWTITSNVSPKLYKYSDWGQYYPFNKFYPKRRKYIVLGRQRKVPAGCFPLAVAKTMAYFRFPQQYSHNGFPIDWSLLNYDYFVDGTSETVAHLLRGLASGMDSWYFYQGTFTFPSKAVSFLRNVGFINVHDHKYRYEMLKEMLDNDCPVIISSVPHNDVTISHAWNIDGYKTMERTVYYKKYKGDVLIDSHTTVDTRKMLHCDFGWYGRQNGYYVEGVFKLDHIHCEKDDPYHKPMTRNYNKHLKIITYNKPL